MPGLACPLSCGKLIFTFLSLAIIAIPTQPSHVPENWHRAMPLAGPPWQLDQARRLCAPHLTTNQQVRVFQEHLALWHARCISMTVRHLPWLEYKPRTDHRICDRSSRGDAQVLSSRSRPGCRVKSRPSLRWWTD